LSGIIVLYYNYTNISKFQTRARFSAYSKYLKEKIPVCVGLYTGVLISP